ncbi:hypothetical protein Patl1_08963 [Pistacia atlantica]|uniref:Uncharacterized protein n=1 Tax=Pistacia atlantica TaxID=434234 RepID=A0ACC1AI86_9ROSI|nr:hypothetical protein Patl1_08963 [Pistacia atlantica]
MQTRGIANECGRIGGHKPAPIPYTEEQLKGMFWRFDKNGDRRLSKQELKAAFKELGALIPGFRANRGLHHADANGDGYISDEEVDKLVKYAYQLGYKVN